ncbi:Ig-like domain repeat protein [Aeromicrobium duanguangcaii]|uniref:Ig-like domain repeat protein n=1 Tax=Aeromicrobium duanguangcaii TaxID=2968086 RepID=A0ABY5KEW3_9ACTN|nr:Ig-like domain repeat protein [Aeromicrobium duanguangcaii]MCD9154077.1 Ig-like domain repeat protein [Aeromicrobium duanguangcaii]UUI68849.1 Ig-like domain repeat protein [Aeromicrobium duanguangcaii]
MAFSGLSIAPATAVSDTSTWTGLGADSKWSTAGNWDIVPSAGANLVFPDISDSARHTSVNDFAAGTAFGTITVQDSGYAISGASLVPTGVAADFSGTSTISAPLRLSASEPVTSVAGAATLALSGTLTGASGFTKSGTGTLTLSAANSYAGVTRVDAGTLAIANSSALGAWSTDNGTEVSAGATLEVRDTINTSEPIRIAGDGVGGAGALDNGTGNNVVQGVTMTGDSTIGGAAGTFLLIPSTLGQSGGSARLTKAGAGILDVLATASHTGGTVVAAGTLATEGTVGGPVAVRAGATVSGAGGNLGDVTSSGGTVTAGYSSSPFSSDAASLTLDSSSTFHAQLNGPAEGNGSTGHSRLHIARDVQLAGATLTAAIGGGYAPSPGAELTIIAVAGATAITGTFKDLPEGALVTPTGGAGGKFRISYIGGTGNDIVLTYFAGSTTALTVSPNPSAPGQTVTLKASVQPTNATGTVTFTDGATTLGTSSLVNGTATLTTAALAKGVHSLTATYNGDESFVPSASTTVTQSVVEPDPVPDTRITEGPVEGSVDNPMTASFTFDSPDSDVASYECSLDGAAFAACASPAAYSGLNGGNHTFSVRAVDEGGQRDPTPAVRSWSVTGSFVVTGGLAITGTAKVGQTLTAMSTVGTTPASTSVSGQWWRGETPIPGATGTTYVLTNDDVSSVISYRETRTRTGYRSITISSGESEVVTGGIITLDAPTISGEARVDEVLTATPGSVSPSDAAVTLTWHVDGETTGVSGPTYTVQPADVGLPITVTARATKNDHDPVSRTSVATDDVAKAVFATAPSATVSGVLKVGEELTAGHGSPTPEPDSMTYQWFAGGDAITGATSRTFTVQKAQQGLPITVTVTAVRAGYVDASNTSFASAPVVTNRAPSLTLTPTAKRLRQGKSTTLSWTSDDAVTLKASGAWSGTKAASGNETVKPARAGTQTYVLSATNAAGTTTAQVAIQVALPPKKLKLKARASVKAGRTFSVSTSGLAPREVYTVRIGGKKVASGKASSAGRVKRTVRVPASTKAGKRLVRVSGSLTDRTGTRRIKVVKVKPRAKALTLSLRESSVRASDDQRITVRNLRPGEKVEVRYLGLRISAEGARADAKGVYVKTFDVGITWGPKTVTATGLTTGRSVSGRFSVVNRCPQGGFYCS